MTDTKTDINQTVPPNDANQKKLKRWKQKWRGRYVRALVSQYESYLDQSADTPLDSADGGRAILDKMAQLEFQIESAINQEIMSRVALAFGAFGILLSLFCVTRVWKLRGQIISLTERARKADAGVQALQSSGKNVGEQFSDLKASVDGVNAKLQVFEGRLTPVETAAASLETRVGEITKKLESSGVKKRPKRR